MSEDLRILLDAMNARFDQLRDEINGRLDKLEARMDKLESCMDKLESRMDKLESRMDKLESRMDKLEKDMADVKDFARTNFDVTAKAFEAITRIEKRLDENERATKTNSYDIAALKCRVI